MRSLKSLIGSFKNKKNSLICDEKTVFFIFNKVLKTQLGEIGCTRIAPVRFKGGKLLVQSQNPNWANELFLCREEIRRKVNKKLETEAVLEINVKSM